MLITKIYLAAMSRADLTSSALRKLPHFNLYVDEFQSFANESFANILSEARKYKLNLTLAHQYIEQMSEEVRAAVFGNVGTMICFRVGAYDAEVLEKEFAPVFTAEDLVSLGFTQIYLKLMIDGVTSPPFSATTLAPTEQPLISYKNDIIANSRRTYAKSRVEVENAIRLWSQPILAPVKPKSTPTVTPMSPLRVATPISAPTRLVGGQAPKPPVIPTPIARKPEFHKPFQNPNNISGLRQALKVVLEKKENKVTEKKAEEKINEVPEEVLKKTLGLDEKK